MISLLSSFSDSSLDYGVVDTILTFAACETRSCVSVFIMDDILLEDDESFNVNLERTLGLNSRITLNPVNGTVEIIDDDYLVLHKGDK